eukprot:TRINITY_DN2465_c0_g2_i5.p2 TRINITY_DN2465_c0_g2~~TRINITY_DN2465_c0_g2_i5.p2  ORF type:complete len:128 (-),score=7.39 TRINITY_DN2465_c0_g2_i5:580-963(-)
MRSSPVKGCFKLTLVTARTNIADAAGCLTGGLVHLTAASRPKQGKATPEGAVVEPARHTRVSTTTLSNSEHLQQRGPPPATDCSQVLYSPLPLCVPHNCERRRLAAAASTLVHNSGLLLRQTGFMLP